MRKTFYRIILQQHDVSDCYTFSSIQEWGMYSIVIGYEQYTLFEPFKVMK